MARVSATLTLLLATAASAQSTCTYDDSSCTYTCGAAKFALSSIAVPAAGYFTATGGDTPYYFNLCAAITTITCDGAGPSPACIQNYGQAQPPSLPTGSCASIGTYPAATSSSVGDGSNASLVLSYQGGDGGRSFDITLSCAPTLTPPTATDDGNLKYGIAFGAPAICAGASGGRTGLSYGSLTLILSGVAIFVYIAGGIFYNHRYREMPVVRAARPRAPARTRFARAHPPDVAALTIAGRRGDPAVVVLEAAARAGVRRLQVLVRAEQGGVREVEQQARRGRRGETGAEGGRGGGRRHRDAVRGAHAGAGGAPRDGAAARRRVGVRVGAQLGRVRPNRVNKN